MTKGLEIILRTEKRDVQGNTVTYAVGPLTAGYGMTLGTVLRRALVSSLPGAAVTALRITGLHPKDQKIAYLEEDLTEIVLNVKQLRLRSFSDQRVSMHLNVSGKRTVTAADLVVSPIVEIINPACFLATLKDERAHLKMELLVETGKGYVSADALANIPAGFIPIDAIYTPVHRVKMQVEKTRVGQMTNYDLLLLTMTTDGTITPDEAFEQSAKILMHYFVGIAAYRMPETSRTVLQKRYLSTIPIPWEIYRIPIEDLGLSIRTYNRLRRSGLRTVGHVLSLDDVDLMRIRNFGEKSLLELYEHLRKRQLLPGASDERDRPI